MKKILLALVALLTLTTSAQAMSYEQARERALFLTDKMAYELNLTDDQYEAAYEINLDYLMTVNTYDDLYGDYWRQRNLDLSYILLDWQYRSFCAASYFYRPIYWNAGCWHFGIYARYPHRTYFYFGRPHFYAVYRGGHSWRTNGGRSWYHGRTYGGPRPGSDRRWGMRDGFDRGDYGHGYHGNKPARFGNGSQNHGQAIGNRHFGSGDRGSSTRNNTDKGSSSVNGRPSNNGGFRFGGSSSTTTPNRTFTPTNSNSTNNRVNSSTSRALLLAPLVVADHQALHHSVAVALHQATARLVAAALHQATVHSVAAAHHQATVHSVAAAHHQATAHSVAVAHHQATVHLVALAVHQAHVLL